MSTASAQIAQQLTSHRSLQALLERLATYDDDQIVTRCSYCDHIAWPIGVGGNERTWIDTDQYDRRGGRADVVVSHGICPDCAAHDRRLAAGCVPGSDAIGRM